MVTIVCVGVCYLDTILTVPHFPEEDSKLRATTLTRRRGGNCPNTLEVLQQLVSADAESIAPKSSVSTQEVDLHLISPLPSRSSPATLSVASSLPNINLTHCIYNPNYQEAASSYIIKSAAVDSRTIVNYNDLPEPTLDQFISAAAALPPDTWYHFEGRIPDITLSCMKFLRTAYTDCKISVEIEKPGREGLVELAQEASVVFFSRGWAEHEGFTTPQSCVQEMAQKLTTRNPILFCTWGAEGAVSYHEDVLGHEPALPDITVVDPVGAGDTFTAGALYVLALQPHLSVLKALRLGVLVAGKKIQHEGFEAFRDTSALKKRVSACLAVDNGRP